MKQAVKKKFEIRYSNEAGEDMQYYLQQFKKEAMKKAEEIFGESESIAKEMPNNPDAEHFDMKEMYKTSKAKLKKEQRAVDTNLKDILEEIKTASQKTASEIFKND